MVNKSIADAKEQSAAQLLSDESTHAARRTPPPPIIPRPSQGQVVGHVDAAWDNQTENCGVGGIFSGLEDTVIPLLRTVDPLLLQLSWEKLLLCALRL